MKKSVTEEENLDIIKLEGSKFSHVTFDEKEIKVNACKSIKHESGEQPFRVILNNVDDQPIKLFWKDYNGNER